MASFADILNRPATQIERPKPLPVGPYIWVVKGLPRQDLSQKKKTPFLEYVVQCLQPMDGVDMESLDTALTRADGTKKALNDVSQKLTFYITEDATWRLKKFLKDCGLDVDEEGVSLKQLSESAAGCQFIGSVKHEPTEDGEGVFFRIDDTAPIA